MPTGDLIPLVEAQGDGFVLSRELLEIVGVTGWGGNLWEVKAFVAHLITHFDDGFEHFMDNPDDEWPQFHVSGEFCAYLAERFKDEFLPMSPDWYKQLAEAKLLTLRVPRTLVAEAKLAYHVSTHVPSLLVRGMLETPDLAGKIVPDRIRTELTAALDRPSLELWDTLERIAREMLANGLLDEDELCTLMGLWSEEEYEDFFNRYVRNNPQ